MDSRNDCVFCRIAAHEAPATIRFEDAELAGRLVLTAARVARDAGVGSFRLATNSGAPLQDVFHLHWHVMAGGKMGHPAGVAFSRWT
ncbi:MAG: HIT domain-containing protein [Chloroflexota bacterium]|nr:HIT domain-containing protein [Chloroflexota bacterium]